MLRLTALTVAVCLWSPGLPCLVAEEPSILFVNAGWTGLPHSDLLDARYLADLKEHGYLADVCRMEEIDRHRLFRYNVAVLLWLPPEPHTKAVETFRERLPLLRSFVEAGGGLLFNYSECGTAVVYERTYHRLANELLEPLGLRATPEVIRDPKHSFQRREGMRETFIRTRNLLTHPVTRGITEVHLPTHWWDQNSFTADDSWQVLIRAESTGYVTGEVDAPAAAPHKKGSITSAPGVFAVRMLGKGRIAFDTISPVYTFSDGHHFMNGSAILDDGNVFRLHLQAYAWLAGPSRDRDTPGGFSGPSYSPAAAEKNTYTDVRRSPRGPPRGPSLVPNLPSFLGLYGAHSQLTDGDDTVQELCARAYELGYSYLVFTEPLELMSRKKYERLVQLCAAASSDDFLALPGAEYSSDRLWSPVIEQPTSAFGPSFPGRGHGRPRFIITYLKTWVFERWDEQLSRDDPILRNYPLSPDGSYVVDNGIIYVSNGQPRQCLIQPKKAGVGPWHVVLYNGFATHSYDSRVLFDDSLDWFVDRVGNDYRITPMTYHRMRRVEDIPPVGETFVSATRAKSLQDLKPPTAALVYPWRNQNYVTSGPRIDLYGVATPERPKDYLVVRENEWKLHFDVSSEAGLSEVTVMNGSRVLRRFQLNGEKQYASTVTGYHDYQRYLTLHVLDRNGGLAVSGAQVIHGWRHFYSMSGADLISCNDSTFQVGSNGRLDFAWCVGGVLAGGSQIGPRLNVQHSEITPIARDAHSPRVGGRTGVMIDAVGRSESSRNRLDLHFASEECTVLEQIHEHHSEPGLSPTPTTLARGRVRWTSFTPRLYDWNLLLVETEVEILRDLVLRTDGRPGPRLRTLSYSPDEIHMLDRYVYRGESGVEQATWNPAGSPDEQSPLPHVSIPKGGYLGLWPGSTASLVVYSLDGNADGSLVDSQLRFGLGKGGEKLLKGERFSFRYLVGLKFRMRGPQAFEEIRRLYGLDGSAPEYFVSLDGGELVSTVYALRLRCLQGALKARITACPKLPSDLPLMIEGVNDRWNVSLYDYDKGTIKRVGARDGIAYSALDINVGDRHIFIGHPFVCSDRSVFLELQQVNGAELGEAKTAVIEVHNPTRETLALTISSPLFETEERRLKLLPGSSETLAIELRGWTDRRVTIFTDELTDQIARRQTQGPTSVVLPANSATTTATDAPPSTTTTEETPPTYVIHRATDLTIDGKLDDDDWQSAKSVGDFVIGYEKTGKEEQTVFKMLWDDKYLYFAVVCEDKSLMSQHTDRDGRIPADDSVEIYITPDAKKGYRHFAFYMNIHGALYDVQFDPKKASIEKKTGPNVPKKGKKSSWDAKGVRIATTIDGTLNNNDDTDRSWSMEIAIPFENFQHAAVPLPPRPKDVWRLNPNRHAYNADGSCHYSQWAPTIATTGSFWSPDLFGKVIFSAQAVGQRKN